MLSLAGDRWTHPAGYQPTVATGSLLAPRLAIVKQELRYRWKRMQRDCLWPRKELGARDAEQLLVLWGVQVGKPQAAPA